jgi:hypothetical protein
MDMSEAVWRRSSLCANGSCVEMAVVDGLVAIRDTKVSDGPLLQFSTTSWNEFLGGARTGEFDIGPGQPRPDGAISQ